MYQLGSQREELSTLYCAKEIPPLPPLPERAILYLPVLCVVGLLAVICMVGGAAGSDLYEWLGSGCCFRFRPEQCEFQV